MYQFSLVVPSPDKITHKEAVDNANSLLVQLGTSISDVMPWSTSGKSSVLVHGYPVEQDVQPVLARWLNEGVIYEYHVIKREAPPKKSRVKS